MANLVNSTTINWKKEDDTLKGEVVGIKKSLLKVGLNEEQTFNSGVNSKINFDVVRENNFGDSYEEYLSLSNGVITVNSDKISLVTVNYLLQVKTTNAIYAYIMKNGSQVTGKQSMGSAAVTAISNQCSLEVVVKKGDTIGVNIYPTAVNAAVTNWNIGTFLQVVAE